MQLGTLELLRQSNTFWSSYGLAIFFLWCFTLFYGYKTLTLVISPHKFNKLEFLASIKFGFGIVVLYQNYYIINIVLNNSFKSCCLIDFYLSQVSLALFFGAHILDSKSTYSLQCMQISILDCRLFSSFFWCMLTIYFLCYQFPL